MTILVEEAVVSASVRLAAEAREVVQPAFEEACGENADVVFQSLVTALLNNN